MYSKRSQLEVSFTVLSILRTPTGATRLMQKANTNYVRIMKKLDELIERGLVKKEAIDGRELYSLTDKGVDILKDYQTLILKFRDSEDREFDMF